MSVVKLFYRRVVGLLSKLRVYEERTDAYVRLFERYISGAGVLLDVGCGTGAFSRAVASGGRLVVALDIDENVLRKIDSSESIERVCADAQGLPFRDGSMDCALAISLLEHLERPEKCVEGLFRVLKRGGVVVVQLPNLQYVFEPHSKWPLLCLMPRGFQRKIFELLNYPYVNMEVSIKRILSTFQCFGFGIKEIVKVYHLGLMKLLPVPPAYIFVAVKISG